MSGIYGLTAPTLGKYVLSLAQTAALIALSVFGRLGVLASITTFKTF
jgi:hypothetical protein